MGMLSEQDIYLFREGTHATLYERLGTDPAGLARRMAGLLDLDPDRGMFDWGAAFLTFLARPPDPALVGDGGAVVGGDLVCGAQHSVCPIQRAACLM